MNESSLKIDGEKQVIRLFSWLVDFYNVLRHCWFIVIMLLIGIVALWIAPPGIDVIRSVGIDTRYEVWTSILLFFFLFWWGGINWHGARVLLHFSDILYFNKANSLWIQKYLPRVFGLFPYLIFLVALFNAHNPYTIYYVVTILLGLAFFVFTIFRRNLLKKVEPKGKALQKITKVVPLQPDSYELTLGELKNQWLPIVGMSLLFVLIFVIILIAPYQAPIILTALGVILSALAGWTSLGVLLIFFDKFTYLPLLLTTVLLSITWGAFNWNCNSVIPSHNFTIPERPTYSTYFHEWALSRMEENPGLHKGSRYPVFIITAEGGASRSGYWVGRTLSQMQDKNQHFGEHVLAISSVSGGSLGSGVFTCLYDHYYVSSKNKPEDTVGFTARIKTFLKEDYLSHVTAALVYPDLFQKFIPWSIPSWSRAKYLERAWETPWSNLSEPFNYFDREFTEIWHPKGKALYKTPLMVLNTTHMESGKRAVISYPRFDNTRHTDVIDLLSEPQLASQFKMSEAISSSARFPYITPSSRLIKDDHQVWGHVVDGGYYENSGLYTALDIYNQIKTDTLIKEKYFQVRFIVIRAFPDTEAYAPLVTNNELIDPIRTLLKTRTARNSHSNGLLELMLEEEGIPTDTLGQYNTRFVLDRGNEVPVNWYLSEAAINCIESDLEKQKEAEGYQHIVALLAPWEKNTAIDSRITHK